MLIAFLIMVRNKWTDTQRHRINILFKHYPILKRAYELAMEHRFIYLPKDNSRKGYETDGQLV